MAVVPSLLPQPLGRGHWEPSPGGLIFFWQSVGNSSPHPLGFQEQLCVSMRGFYTSTQLLLAY